MICKSIIILLAAPFPQVNISSSPLGYGILGQQITLMCEVFLVTNAELSVEWKFNGAHINSDGPLTNRVVTYTIIDFKSSNEGSYSCIATNKYWSISSVNIYVKMAGNMQ